MSIYQLTYILMTGDEVPQHEPLTSILKCYYSERSAQHAIIITIDVIATTSGSAAPLYLLDEYALILTAATPCILFRTQGRSGRIADLPKAK
jgi:hypothetical protein